MAGGGKNLEPCHRTHVVLIFFYKKALQKNFRKEVKVSFCAFRDQLVAGYIDQHKWL